jgi:GT2 family glycosyltransferase
VESLQIEWKRDGRDSADLEVIVCDSGSEAIESTWWRSLATLGAKVVTCDENVGYAAGLNRAFEESSGRPQDVVALLNPDLYFLPGSLRPLLERLDGEPEVALVAPRCFIDEARSLCLPPNELPSGMRELSDSIAARVPGFGRHLAANRSKSAREWWGSEQPVEAEMISGACMFLRREVICSLGSPMDGEYPLYFEDADLCARLFAAGWRMEMVPEAEVLHHWSRTAGPEFQGEVAERWTKSRERYFKIHQDSTGAQCAEASRVWFDRAASIVEPQPIHEFVDLGALSAAPCLELNATGSYQLEISITAHFGLSAGGFFEGESYSFDARTWNWLFPGTYFVRVIDRESGALQGAWSFQKTSAARSWPLDPSCLPTPRLLAVCDPAVNSRQRVG